MPNRLFVDSLVSIGVVAAGDNPDAQVLVYKSRDFDKHALPGSIDAQVELIRRAYDEQFPSPKEGPHRWVSSVFESFVIVEVGDDTFRVVYTISDDDVSFGTPEEVDLETTIIGKLLEADVYKRKFSREQREALAAKGQALPDGSFPIVNKSDLSNALSAFGRAGNKAAARKHIIRRAKALGATDSLPDDWNVSKMIPKAGSLQIQVGDRMSELDLSAIEDKDLRKSIEDAVGELETKNAELAKTVAEAEPKEDPVEKADPEVQAILKAQAEKITELEDNAVKERSDRLATEFLAKAKPLGVVVGKADEAGPVLAELAEKAPDAYAKLEPMLTTAAKRINEGGLFKEYGAGEGEGDADPISKRDKFVADFLKENADKNETDARAAFWKAHPEAKEELRS